MSSIENLREIVASLRDPEAGCRWDREQDFASIAPYTVEEAYEVADAIARADMTGLCDELGDLLFQVVFHAQMAAEAGAFDFDDVASGICRKMLRRHPHVFGNAAERARGAVPGSWERIKTAERQATTNMQASILDGIANALPFETLAGDARLPDIDVMLPFCVQQGWIAGFEGRTHRL